MVSSNFILNFTRFCVIFRFFDHITNIRCLFSTAVRTVNEVFCFFASFILGLRAVVVANLVILGTSPLTSFILALRVVIVNKLLISGISSLFFILALYTSFLTT